MPSTIAVVLTSVLCLGSAPAASQFPAPPRDPRPGAPRAESTREVELKRTTATNPSDIASWLELARLQEARGAYAEAERSLTSAAAANRRDLSVLSSLAAFLIRNSEFDRGSAALEEMAAREPENPQGHQLVAVYSYDKASKDAELSPRPLGARAPFNTRAGRRGRRGREGMAIHTDIPRWGGRSDRYDGYGELHHPVRRASDTRVVDDHPSVRSRPVSLHHAA